MSIRQWFSLACVLSAAAVAIGAFGAHGLQTYVSPEGLDIYDTGARYHLIHAVGLFAVSFALSRWQSRFIGIGGWLLVIGIVLFSGSLYALGITGVKALGAITPFGGAAFILGWLVLAFGILRGDLRP